MVGALRVGSDPESDMSIKPLFPVRIRQDNMVSVPMFLWSENIIKPSRGM